MTSEEAAVAAANTTFYRALEARDLVAMDRIWAHEESASCVHPGWHRLDGWTEIRRSWENIFANARPWSVFCEDVRVEVSGDLAWVTCVEAITPSKSRSTRSCELRIVNQDADGADASYGRGGTPTARAAFRETARRNHP